MILLSLDFETTGVNTETDRPIEVGAILYSTGQAKCLASYGVLIQSDVPVSQEITNITGITQSAVDKFGVPSEQALKVVLRWIQAADAFIGQNIIRFDKKVLKNWAGRHGEAVPDKLYIDTMTDLPGTDGKHLGYMAADHGFLNMFPHAALSDCQTVLKLVSMYQIDKVIERANSPVVVVRSHQRRDQNDLVKKRRFRWNPDRKIWWKPVKEMDLDALLAEAPFDISIEKQLTVEDLDS